MFDNIDIPEDESIKEGEFRKYFSVKYWDDDNVYTRLFFDNEQSKKQFESACRNGTIEKVSNVFFADCRSNADRIAMEEFGIAEEIE